MENKKLNFILFFLVIAIIVLLGLTFYTMKEEGVKCQTQPAKYFVENIKKANPDSNFQCSCTISNPKGEARFLISNEGDLMEDNLIQASTYSNFSIFP